MKIFESGDELAAVLRNLSEAGLIDITIGDGGEATFTLSAAITKAGLDAITALLAGIEAIADPRQGV
jgi:16S rRNA C1402 N4-methylase RsmH